MKNLIKKYSIVIALITLFAVGCDSGFEETNTNPNSPNTVSPNLLLGQISFNTANLMYSTFNGGDMGSCWSQQLAKVQYNDEARYTPRQGSVNNVWDGLYINVISDADAMYKLADAEGNNNLKGIALVLQAYGYSVLTDLYGDIPYTEAMNAEGGVISPAYDTQEAVYNGIFTMLDNASALLGTGGMVVADTDLVYSGDVAKWEKFANSLKFRSLMRVSSKMNVSADLQALLAKPMFGSTSDDASFNYQVENPNANPLYETIDFGNRSEWKVCEQFIDRQIATTDPRIENMVSLNDAGIHRGKPAGILNVPNDDYNVTNVSAIGAEYLKGNAAGNFMTHSELEFLIAEAITRSDISISAGTASDHYNAGIASSFLNSNTSAGLASFQAGVALTGIENGDLEKIATQNWIGLFCQGFESFIEQRRTGFPVIPMPIDAALTEMPVRLNYPNIESSINATNYNAAIANQGADLLTTKMWRLQP